MIQEFIQYLLDQVGEPYLWGGQHTKLTPETYQAIIHKREDGRGKYSDGTTYADACIAYCKKLFDAGATVLYAYDCSGLGVYWLEDVKHIWKSDVNANTMMSRCENLDTANLPRKGWWCFRLDLNKTRATHIGYMTDDSFVVQAEGRKYGVTKKKFKASDWDVWGIPKVFKDEILNPPQPEPPSPEPPAKQQVLVKGKSVWVRDSGSTKGKKLFVAHKGQTFDLIDVAETGWYHIMTAYPEAYITNKSRYTELKQ